jgi:hypothetical protein
MAMMPFFRAEALNIAALVLIALWSFPTWAERMLTLKERWDSRRDERPQR